MGPKGIVFEGVKSVHPAEDRDKLQAVVDKVMNLRLPYKSGYQFLRKDSAKWR
jgi:hypothetical protein